MYKLSLKACAISDCVSYTAASMILSLLSLSPAHGPDINLHFNLELFLCTTLIAVFMFPTSRIPVESRAADILIKLSIVAAVILGVGGGLFKWFPWTPFYVAEVVCILMVVFVFTYGLLLWNELQIAKKINQKIKEGKDGPHH